eukprot:snap_masked-scaffold_14-processed-gene-4.31-mRNA-1 protein AED:1.00 eAED:1.00 QI:0/0/0/0/1/1/6/0/704
MTKINLTDLSAANFSVNVFVNKSITENENIDDVNFFKEFVHVLSDFVEKQDRSLLDMIEDDYSSFLALSSKLVDVDKLIDSLKRPFTQITKKIEETRKEIAKNTKSERILKAEEKSLNTEIQVQRAKLSTLDFVQLKLPEFLKQVELLTSALKNEPSPEKRLDSILSGVIEVSNKVASVPSSLLSSQVLFLGLLFKSLLETPSSVSPSVNELLNQFHAGVEVVLEYRLHQQRIGEKNEQLIIDISSCFTALDVNTEGTKLITIVSKIVFEECFETVAKDLLLRIKEEEYFIGDLLGALICFILEDETYCKINLALRHSFGQKKALEVSFTSLKEFLFNFFSKEITSKLRDDPNYFSKSHRTTKLFFECLHQIFSAIPKNKRIAVTEELSQLWNMKDFLFTLQELLTRIRRDAESCFDLATTRKTEENSSADWRTSFFTAFSEILLKLTQVEEGYFFVEVQDDICDLFREHLGVLVVFMEKGSFSLQNLKLTGLSATENVQTRLCGIFDLLCDCGVFLLEVLPNHQFEPNIPAEALSSFSKDRASFLENSQGRFYELKREFILVLQGEATSKINGKGEDLKTVLKGLVTSLRMSASSTTGFSPSKSAYVDDALSYIAELQPKNPGRYSSSLYEEIAKSTLAHFLDVYDEAVKTIVAEAKTTEAALQRFRKRPPASGGAEKTVSLFSEKLMAQFQYDKEIIARKLQ